MTDPMIWINGDYQSPIGVIDARDRGFLLGDGIFETIRVQNGKPIYLSAHLARLARSLTALSFPGEIIEGVDFREIIAGLARHNGAPGFNAARITVSRGVGARGLALPDASDGFTLMVSLSPYLRPEGPLSVMVSRYRRSSMSVSARHKTTNYLDNIMAKSEAVAGGFDDSLMVNEVGRLACASAANVFVMIGKNTLATPMLTEGALPGIIRQRLIDHASQIGIEIYEQEIPLDDAATCPVFLTNSLIGVVAVKSAEGDFVFAPDFQRISKWLDDDMKKDEAMQ